jgi:hypothetical protein
VRAAFTTSGPAGEAYVDGTAALPTGTSTHVAVTINSTTMTLYVNGASVGFETVTESLSSLDDVNNWLGASQFDADPAFEGSISEFRIYNTALTSAQVQQSYTLGADTPLSQ